MLSFCQESNLKYGSIIGGWSVITKFSSKFIMTIYEVNDKESEFRFNNRDKDIYKLLLNNANENML